MTREERNAVARLRRRLHDLRMLFIVVGEPHRGITDRVVSTMTELPSGATVNSREHTALLLDLVRCARGKR